MIVWYTSSAAGFVLIDRPYFSMIVTNCCSCGSAMYPAVRSDLRGGMKYIVSLYLSRLSLSATNWMNFHAASACLLCFEIASQSVQLVVTCCFLATGSATTRFAAADGLFWRKSRTVSRLPSCIATRLAAIAPTFAVGAAMLDLLAT